MKLRAKKITTNPCLVRHTEADGGYLDTFHVGGGDIIEINLDDFEVVDPEGLEFVGIRGELYKITYQPEPIEKLELPDIAPRNFEEQRELEERRTINQIIDAINRLQEDR